MRRNDWLRVRKLTLRYMVKYRMLYPKANKYAIKAVKHQRRKRKR